MRAASSQAGRRLPARATYDGRRHAFSCCLAPSRMVAACASAHARMKPDSVVAPARDRAASMSARCSGLTRMTTTGE